MPYFITYFSVSVSTLKEGTANNLKVKTTYISIISQASTMHMNRFYSPVITITLITNMYFQESVMLCN